MAKPITVEDFIAVLNDTELNAFKAQRKAIEQEHEYEKGAIGVESEVISAHKNACASIDAHIARLEKRRVVLESCYQAVVVSKVMILKLRRVDGDDLLRVKSVLKGRTIEQFLQSVEGRVKSYEGEEAIFDFTNFDRARVILGLGSSAGHARAWEKEWSLEEAFKKFRESVAKGREQVKVTATGE